MAHYRWQLLTPPPTPSPHLALPPLLAQLLYNRGITDAGQVDTFLAVDERLLFDPYLLPDMPVAVSRTYQALLRGEKIAVYGDFDADGITATALLVEGLSALGGNPLLYIPHRMEEGHGLHASALEKLRQQGVSLVITVDCGVTACQAVAQAQEAGQDIIITDHHRPASGGLPTAVAIVNPYRAGSAYPFPDLAGVGVAYKFLQALLAGMGRENEGRQYLDLVALGTVADMVILVGENRYLVRHGLELINDCRRPGLKELLRLANLGPGSIDAESISHILGPRLNAAGRMEHAMLSYRLLTSSSPQEIQELAARLVQCNEERQRLTDEVLVKAREAARGQEDLPILIVEGKDFWAGVVGVVAGQLTQEFYHPAVVVEWGPETCHGSARSIPEFDIIAALNECSDLLGNFGGHSQAAGFNIPTDNMPELRRRLIDIARHKLEGLDLQPRLLIDAELPLANLDGQVFPLLQRLAPFGKGNPTPTFLSRGVQVVECRRIGNQGEHLRFKLKQDRIVWPAVGFDLSSLIAGTLPLRLDMVYQLGVNNWQGKATLELRILDFIPSTTP